MSIDSILNINFLYKEYGFIILILAGCFLVAAILMNLVQAIKNNIKEKKQKLMLLCSSEVPFEKVFEILKKPAYDTNVAFITTAVKPQENKDYAEKDRQMMIDMGFNVEEVDIEGKSRSQLLHILHPKDIIFVEGGNTFYLQKRINESGFEKVLFELFTKGILYIGVSAGAMVAGRTIETANWKDGDKNFVKLKNLKGMGFAPFNLFVHYKPEHAEIIKKEMLKSKYPLRVLTDQQALFIVGKDVEFISKTQPQ